jgi:3-deoxy-manno-octulosonate cytidylyltransferase (CMP-KDO synthetase)
MTASRVLAVIPARLGSRRFSRKVTYPLNGKPLLFYIYRDVLKAATVSRVVIATPDREIVRLAEDFGAEVARTSRRHQTGSDRVAEVAETFGGDIILNVQADNFGLKASVLDTFVRRIMADRTIRFATLARRIYSDHELFSPNLVKVIVSGDSEALWFSRYPLPYLQDYRGRKRHEEFAFLGHIGVYGFRRKALSLFASWRRAPLEKAESLEQLRIIENGERIRVFTTRTGPVEINSPADLKKLHRIYR